MCEDWRTKQGRWFQGLSSIVGKLFELGVTRPSSFSTASLEAAQARNDRDLKEEYNTDGRVVGWRFQSLKSGHVKQTSSEV